MASYRRLAALCLLLLSSTKIAFGKIRGNYYASSLEGATIDGINGRHLMKGRKGGRKMHKGIEKGVKGVKGEIQADEDTYVPTHLDSTYYPTDESTLTPGAKGTNPGQKGSPGQKGDKINKLEGGKTNKEGSLSTPTDYYYDNSGKSGKYKGGKSKEKGGKEYSGKSKGGEKGYQGKGTSGSKKGGMSKYHYGKAIERKSHSYSSEKSKGYDKSKDKLQKSSEGKQ
jgi:hypothetical protein